MATVEDLEAELRGVQDAMVHAITALTARVDALTPPEERGNPPLPARPANGPNPSRRSVGLSRHQDRSMPQ